MRAAACSYRNRKGQRQGYAFRGKPESLQSQDLRAAGIAEAKSFAANHRAARSSVFPPCGPSPGTCDGNGRSMARQVKEKGLRRRMPSVRRRRRATPNVDQIDVSLPLLR